MLGPGLPAQEPVLVKEQPLEQLGRQVHLALPAQPLVQEQLTEPMLPQLEPLELVQLVERIDDNVTEDSWESNLKADVQFHSRLVASAGSPRLHRLYSAIFAEVKLCIYHSRHIVPINPDNSPIINVSALNILEIFRLLAPIARKIPISFVRS